MNAGQQRLRIGYTADAQIDMFVLQPSLLALDLLQQRAADAADADDKHFNHLVGVEQHLMGHAHAGGGVVIADHHRNRALGRALGNRHDIDIGAGQRRKNFAEIPRRVRIPSPTTEMMARRSIMASGSSSPSFSSR